MVFFKYLKKCPNQMFMTTSLMDRVGEKARRITLYNNMYLNLILLMVYNCTSYISINIIYNIMVDDHAIIK